MTVRPRDLSAGAPCWLDLGSSSVETIRDFYTALFGWTAREADPQFGGYFMFEQDGAPVAGCSPAMPGSVPDIWSVYLTVEDAAKTADLAREAGGQVIVEPMTVGDAGTMAFIADPGGAAIGLWQPGDFAGIATVGAAGQPSWFELHTRAYDQVLPFYRDVLGWDLVTLQDQPGMRYSALQHGQTPLAGIMDASGWDPSAPLAWRVYFWTDDADAAVRKVQELGGSVVDPPEDTPYGRLATVADPAGAIFKLMAANDQMPQA